ncbi:astacin-like metalloendopeptidase [Dendrobates tinctorius]|uniref:astacin-like metalloendopeptidase n=1 Tax=Dendrobates tinctorius TaxID=92724 RepID=UPI003CC962FE
MRSLLLVALGCVGLAVPYPILRQRKRRDAEDTPGAGTNLSWFDRIYSASSGSFFTGRFIIKNLDIAYNIGRSANLCPKSTCLWPSSKDGFVYIPYTISSDFGSYDTIVIKASLSDIEGVTCIRFKPKTSETDYITFVASTGCWSSVGHIGGVQYISLEKPGCVWSGIITHEVLHTLGLNHEHVRRDRDKHVEVQWNNIQSDAKSNFEMVDTYNKDLTAYDYDSILHYPNGHIRLNRLIISCMRCPDSSLVTKVGKSSQETGCGGNLTGPEGALISPNYPQNYPSNAYCHWNITTTERFRITVKDFDIEGDDINCQYDKLRIYNGRDFDVLYQLRDFCGQNLPLPITSYSNSMQIVFTSDLSIEKRGFSLVYQRERMEPVGINQTNMVPWSLLTEAQSSFNHDPSVFWFQLQDPW